MMMTISWLLILLKGNSFRLHNYINLQQDANTLTRRLTRFILVLRSMFELPREPMRGLFSPVYVHRSMFICE